MTDANKVKDDKVASLNQTLTSVENELMGRALDRRDKELDHTLDCINRGIEAGVIEPECGGDGGNGADADGGEPSGDGGEPAPEGGEGEPGGEEGGSDNAEE